MNWYYDQPQDEECLFNRRVVYSEQDILGAYWAHWCKMMLRAIATCKQSDFVTTTTEADITYETCISDWIVTNWAQRTDMPSGVYVTRNHYTIGD